MKNFRRQSPTVNAGSMADIAFLLLIFFLVTTTISADKGILRKLPADCPPNSICSERLNERNVLRIIINANNEILVEDEQIQIKAIAPIIQAFVDNNGKNNCDYCDGLQASDASDHPKSAVISLKHDPLTKYNFFITVQDEISNAFFNLRARYAKEKFNKKPEQLSKAELNVVKKAYPFVLSEVTVKRNN